MNRKLSFSLGLIFVGILMILMTFNLFYIVAIITKIILYVSAGVAIMGGLYEIVELIRTPKK